MSTPLRVALAVEIGCLAEDITDITVRWDSGDRYFPYEENDNVPPELVIEAVVEDPATGKREGHVMDTGLALRALFLSGAGLL